MYKIVKIILGMILAVVVLIVLGIFVLIKIAEHREANYCNYTQVSGEIEMKYTAFGGKNVSYMEFDAHNDVIGKYAVWYPSELDSRPEKYPVVIFANGTGSTAATYKPFMEHLASWGFIVIGNDDKNTRTGISAEAALQFLIQLYEDTDSIFCHKIDLDNIGIGGHSQGGVAAFNTVTDQEHGFMIKALYAASATSSYHTDVMADQWGYDVSKITIPTFLTAGTGYWDAGTAASKEQGNSEENGAVQGICPLWSLQENYALLPDTIDKVMARKKNTDHGDSYKQFDGYMTAWFMYYLQGDQNAGKAFGNGGELSENRLYQDVQTNIN